MQAAEEGKGDAPRNWLSVPIHLVMGAFVGMWIYEVQVLLRCDSLDGILRACVRLFGWVVCQCFM